MLHKGFENVYHLKGGILKYLENTPESESLWTGECFVFDQRAAVSSGVAEGQYEFCRSCRHPLTANERDNEAFEEGVCCLNCYDTLSSSKKASARERNLQIRLAGEKNSKHLGYQVKKNQVFTDNVEPLCG